MGATPATTVETAPAALPVRPPPPPLSADESPFGGGADNDAEAAALAAEAAAVRALDDGPQTPPPELMSAAPAQPAAAAEEPRTPPPEVVARPRTPAPEVAAATETPAPEITAVRMPPPEVVAASRTPSPDAAETIQTPPPEVAAAPTMPSEITAVRTPPPDVVAASRTPAPEFGASRAAEDYSSPIAAAAAAAATDADQVTPPPEPKDHPAGGAPVEGDGGALPTLAMQANAGLANLPAVALSDAEGGTDSEVDGDEHVEMMEGAEGVDDDGEPSVAATAKALRGAPPPIPGSHLRTPGPELLVPRPEPVAATAPAAELPALIPEALAQRPRRPRRSKPWFEEVFDEDYLRTLPFMRADQTLREVEFISDALRVGPAAEILDIGCGYGRHAIELVQRGYNVTGLDLSLPLLIRAADEAQRRSLAVNFVHADMREMAFEKQFDGAYSMLTSFGYFDEDTNLRVAERIGRALKPGARFLLDIVNRDYVVSDLPVRVWWEGTGCVVLEEVDFNFHTSRIVTHRSIVFEDGRQLEQEISVRAYSLHEIGRLLRQAGFRVMDVSGALNTRGQFFGNVSRSLLIVAEKRESDTAQPL
jgi:SAM-dependent methyltransferase